MSIEQLSDGLWVPSTDAQIEQWREEGYPYMQDNCLNKFLEWCKEHEQKFNLVVDVGTWCGTWTLSMQQYAKNRPKKDRCRHKVGQMAKYRSE